MEHEQIALWTAMSSDPELIAGVRAGDVAAFGLLYERHADAARRVAVHYTNAAADVDDVVAEAFSRVLRALQQGDGPDLAFRAYLFTIVRRTGLDLIERNNRTQPREDMGEYEAAIGYGESSDAHAITGFEQGLVADAFRALPERWQAVLWYTEVEKKTPAQIAPLLGLSANGVAALAYRAREALRQSYLQQHLAVSHDEECRTINLQFGSFVRGGLSKREQSRVESHLAHCPRCEALVAELEDVNRGLRGVIAPLVLGIAALALLDDGLPVGGAFAHLGGTGSAAAGGGVTIPGGAGGATLAAALTAAGIAFTTAAAPASDAASSGLASGAALGGGGAAAVGVTAGVIGAEGGTGVGAATATGTGVASGTGAGVGAFAGVAGTSIAGAAAGGSAAAGTGILAGAASLLIPVTAVTATITMVLVGVTVSGGLNSLVDDDGPTVVAPTGGADASLGPVPPPPSFGDEAAQPSANPSPSPSETPTPTPTPQGDDAASGDGTGGTGGKSPSPRASTDPTSDPSPTPTTDPSPTPTPDPDPGSPQLLLARAPLDFLEISAADPFVTLSLTNTGDAAAADVTASIELPAGLSFAAPGGGGGSLGMFQAPRLDKRLAMLAHESFAVGDWQCVIVDPTNASCERATIAVGQSADVTLDVSIDASLATDATTVFAAESGDANATYAVRTGVETNDEQVDPIYADTGSLAAVHVGATLLGCDSAEPGCTSVMSSTVSGTDGSLNNNGWTMVALNEEGGVSNSAGTVLSLPDGAVVTYASLEWAANRHTSDALVGDAAAARLRVPGAADYVDIEADTVTVSNDPAGRVYYQSRLDVTDLVAAAGSGEYALADIALPGTRNDPDKTYAAGFGLTVVYTLPGLSQSRVAIFDGAQWISADDKADFTFVTDAGADVTLGWTVFEADRGLLGDRVDIDGDTFAPLRWDGTTTSVGDSGNAADGTAFGGVHGNTLGIDAKMFRPGHVPSGSHIITVQTSGDNFLLSTLTVTVAED